MSRGRPCAVASIGAWAPPADTCASSSDDAAEADVLDAALWYEQRSPGLGHEFLAAVDAALTEIAAMLERYPVVRGEARRALLRRFPYGVYFVASAELVSVVACMHARRHPRRWQERSDADR